jgi:hypothetical protein
VRDITWPDPGLGCPQPGMAYKQAPVDGLLIRLESDGQLFEYHSGGGEAPFLRAANRWRSGDACIRRRGSIMHKHGDPLVQRLQQFSDSAVLFSHERRVSLNNIRLEHMQRGAECIDGAIGM